MTEFTDIKITIPIGALEKIVHSGIFRLAVCGARTKLKEGKNLEKYQRMEYVLRNEFAGKRERVLKNMKKIGSPCNLTKKPFSPQHL